MRRFFSEWHLSLWGQGRGEGSSREDGQLFCTLARVCGHFSGWHLFASLPPSCPPNPRVSLLHPLCLNCKASSVLPLELDSLDLHPAAAAAKLPQSCPTLCDPRDGSPPNSPVPGILQARTLEWVAISFSHA